MKIPLQWKIIYTMKIIEILIIKLFVILGIYVIYIYFPCFHKCLRGDKILIKVINSFKKYKRYLITVESLNMMIFQYIFRLILNLEKISYELTDLKLA